MMMNKSVSAVDLFCGVGGMTHGLIKAGISVNAGIDSDETCAYAYGQNNKCRFINEDVREISSSYIKRLYPKKDIKILVGCAPCQPFSNHTQKDKNRREDEQWGLLYSFSRLVEEVKPEIVSMENVVQIAEQEVFTDFVECLESLGYHVFWKPVFCPDYGIPQTRTRLLLLASKLGAIKIIPKTHTPSTYRTVRAIIGKLELIEDGQVSNKDLLHKAPRLSPVNKKRIQQAKPGGTWLDWDDELRLPCHKRESGRTYVSVYGRMKWDEPAPTITTQFYNFGTGRFGHPEQDRALSLREGALLQTFPRYYIFVDPNLSITFRRTGTHIGNAVPVRLGAIIGRSILRHLESVNHA
jgi:DNA (cytosine-5)-methyltransferase 1